MGNVLNIASSGLSAMQTAISVTGNNLANVNTEGYSRQRVNFGSADTVRFGENFLGNGVQLQSIDRITDTVLVNRLQGAISLEKGFEEYLGFANDIDSLLSGDSSSISVAVQDFFSSLHTAVENPAYPPSRQSFMSQSEMLVNRFHMMDTKLSELDNQINHRYQTIVDDINVIAENLARINSQIAGSATPPPDLLDQRDILLDKLSEYVSVMTIPQEDGGMSISIGTGQALVVGGTASRLEVKQSLEDPSKLVVTFAGTTMDVSSSLTGGALGGLYDFRQEVMEPARSTLSRIALVMSDTFNQQHRLGMNQDGDIGTDFFTDVNSTKLIHDRSIAHASNAGTGVLTVTIDNTSDITLSDYRLTVSTGPSYNLTRLSDNSVTTFASFPETVDGFTLDLDSGALAVSDSFIISPTKNAIHDMDLNITELSDMALASPVRVSSSLSNTGSANIEMGLITDTTTSTFTTTPNQLSPPLRVEYLSPTSYQIVNSNTSAVIEGPIVYDPGSFK